MAGSSDDYEIGYGKPPPERRFVKGQSGNPSGKAKKRARRVRRKNLAEIAAELGDQILTVNQNGKVRRITLKEAFVSKLSQRALEGDARSTKIFAELLKEGIAKRPAELEDFDLEALAKDPHAAARAYQQIMGTNTRG